MTQSQQSHSSKSQHVRTLLKYGVLALLLCLVTALLYIGWQLNQLQKAVQERDLLAVNKSSQNILPFAKVFAPKALGDGFILAPLRLIPEIAISATQVATQIPSIVAQQTSGSIDFRPVRVQLKQLELQVTALTHNLEENSPFVYVAERKYPGASALAKRASASLSAVNQLIDTNGQILLLLQNTDELRATGGFMGSYVVITIHDGQVSEWIVEDIYDADGQFTGYIEAPPGVKEYLSSNRGLRLPDANWDPDFPTSAQQILQFFALSDRPNIHTVATINLTLAEQVMGILGPIKLPDYAMVIHSENISTALRAEREEFFAGSIQKKHVLEQLLVQIQLRLTTLTTKELLELLKVVPLAVSQRSVQVFATNPQLQATLQTLGLTGELTVLPQSNPLFLIESNVGINKANRETRRTITITKHDKQIEVDLTIQNNNMHDAMQPMTTNSANQTVYSNYQRLFVQPDWELNSIAINGTNITPQSTRTVTTYAGNELTEYGFLVQVPEQTTASIKFLLHTENADIAAYPVVFTPQSGTSPANIQFTLTN